MYSRYLKFVGFLLPTSLALRVGAQTRELHVCEIPIICHFPPGIKRALKIASLRRGTPI